MKEDTIQHLASEMDELQEQHRDVLAKVRFSMNSQVIPFVFLLLCEKAHSEAESLNQFDIFYPDYTYVQFGAY